jgi:hypothetical protein
VHWVCPWCRNMGPECQITVRPTYERRGIPTGREGNGGSTVTLRYTRRGVY